MDGKKKEHTNVCRPEPVPREFQYQAKRICAAKTILEVPGVIVMFIDGPQQSSSVYVSIEMSVIPTNEIISAIGSIDGVAGIPDTSTAHRYLLYAIFGAAFDPLSVAKDIADKVVPMIMAIKGRVEKKKGE